MIIGVFLLFLALGYQRGGQAYENPLAVLRRNFLMAAIWLGIGLSYFFIAFFFSMVQSITGPHIVYPLIAYLLMMIAPLIYILGQTVPIVMNMAKQNQTAGMIGGNALSLSTVGSFLGAILTTLILMYYLGVAWTVVVNCALLIFLALLLSENSQTLCITLSVTIAVMGLSFIINVGMEKQFFYLTNHYANYQIQDSKNTTLPDGERILMINDTASSYTNQKHQGFDYIELIKKILFQDMQLRDKDILVLGAGGFSLSDENTFNNRFTYVDIDPQIKKIAEHYTNHAIYENLIADDARHYLKSTHKRYDAIVIDVYSDIKAIPAHLITKEYMSSIQDRLKNHGTVIFNIIANPFLSDPYSKRIDNTIRSTFKNCMVVPLHYWQRPENILYVCNQTETQNDKMIYSDNFNRSTTDSFSW